MKPIGPLMSEHRMIERMFALLQNRIEKMGRGTGFDGQFFERLLDFFLVYVDKAHHGKEEEILFTALMAKPLSDDLRCMIEELIAEHASGRKMFNDLKLLMNGVVNENADSPKAIADLCTRLKILYAGHIEKEDAHFFYPVMEYLNREEQGRMLENIANYDARVMHGIYEAVIADWEHAGC